MTVKTIAKLIADEGKWLVSPDKQTYCKQILMANDDTTGWTEITDEEHDRLFPPDAKPEVEA